MKSSAYLLALAFILFASSCKKKDSPYNPSAAIAAVVKTIAHSNTGASDTYTYTGDGKIQLVQNSSGNKTSFEYSNDTVTEKTDDAAGNITSITTIVLDSFGLANSSKITDANGTALSYHTFIFDGAKHKTAQHDYTPNHDVNGKSEWAWGSDNMFNYAIYDSTTTNRIYDFYYWYFDPAVTSIGNGNTGQKFWGVDSKYLVRQFIRHSYIYGDLIETFEYTFDTQQRITTVKTYSHSGSLKNTDSYTYY